MNYLEIKTGLTVIQLRVAADQNQALDEQAAKYLSQNPFLLLDVGNVEFTSMNLGELVNLRARFDGIWGDKLHLIGLLNLNDHGKTIFQKVGLSQMFPFFDTIDSAIKEFHP